jgi:hypothetical protein
MIRVILDFDPRTTALQVTAQDSQNPGAALPPAVVFAVVNAGFITMLSEKIKGEIKAEDARRIVEADGDVLRRLPRPPES